jgi:signal peptidase I
MSPTLRAGHAVLLIRNVNYEDLRVGDVIVFHSNKYGDCIKRIAALHGDSIKQENSELYINNVLMYQYSTYANADYIVGNDELFVLGDNYYNSTDSRETGTVAYSDVVGKIIFL